jgi:hypothetical protein
MRGFQIGLSALAQRCSLVVGGMLGQHPHRRESAKSRACKAIVPPSARALPWRWTMAWRRISGSITAIGFAYAWRGHRRSPRMSQLGRIPDIPRRVLEVSKLAQSANSVAHWLTERQGLAFDQAAVRHPLETPGASPKWRRWAQGDPGLRGRAASRIRPRQRLFDENI